jgi:hypothetical protein
MHPPPCLSRRQRLIGAAAVVSALGLVPRAAHAQTPTAATTQAEGDPVEAQRRFDHARALFEQNDFANALPEFQSSLGMFRSPNTRLYIGLCLARIGRLGEAHTALSLAAQEAAELAPREARYASTRDLARRELEALTPRVARLAVQVAAPVTGLRVRVDNTALPETLYGVEQTHTPGEVVVTAEAPGFLPFSQVVRLGARVTSTVAVRLQPDPNAAAATDARGDAGGDAGGGGSAWGGRARGGGGAHRAWGREPRRVCVLRQRRVRALRGPPRRLRQPPLPRVAHLPD